MLQSIKGQKNGLSATIEGEDFVERMTEALAEDGRVLAKLCEDELYYDSCVKGSEELGLGSSDEDHLLEEMCEKLNLEANATRLTGKEITKLARARR